MRDQERIDRIALGLRSAKLDAMICTLPAYVLMSCGYWPVVGTSICVTSADGRQVVLAPKDEEDLAQTGWAEIRTYKPSRLDKLQAVGEAAADPLRELLKDIGVIRGRIGYEHGPASEPSSYAAMHLFQSSIRSILETIGPKAEAIPADDLLAALACRKTEHEVNKIRISCQIAEHAFLQNVANIELGQRETEVAAVLRTAMYVFGTGFRGVARAEGFAFCMSGPNSAKAHGAYARSRSRTLEKRDLVLIHCNSCADGYWTDVTRTYCLGVPDDKKSKIYDAVFAARTAALQTIRPGVKASEVDRAARQELTDRGYGKEFKHSTGHGVGFSSISANARPRIHPKSEEILEPGMVFNIEPAVYMEEYGGVRHCDMVAVTHSGAEVLTPFHAEMADLVGDELLLKRPKKVA